MDGHGYVFSPHIKVRSQLRNHSPSSTIFLVRDLPIKQFHLFPVQTRRSSSSGAAPLFGSPLQSSDVLRPYSVTGFIGGPVAQALTREGYIVYGLIRKSSQVEELKSAESASSLCDNIPI